MSRNPEDKTAPHRSVSQAKGCLAKVGFERVAKMPKEPPSAAMAFGTCVHGLLEGQYGGVPLDDIKLESFPNPRELKRAKALAAEYEELIGAELQSRVQALEHRFMMEGVAEVPVLGYIDMVYSGPNGAIPVDYKTMGTARHEVTAEEKLQLATYAMALGLPLPCKAEIHALITKGPAEAYVLDTEITEEDADRVRAMFAKLDKAYKTGIFPPKPNQWCGRCMHFDYCGAGEVFDGDIKKFMAERDNPAEKKKEEKKVMGISFEKASAIRPYLKVALIGEPGTLKTRTLLAFPSPVVIDTESGTDHYGKEFDFERLVTSDPNKVAEAIAMIAENPQDRKTFGIDSWSVYCESMTSKFVDLFLVTEKKSAGHKGDYYRLQPRDYQPINRAIMQQIKALMKLRCHVVITMQVKDEWAGMEKVGLTFDGYKRSPYYFDTVITIRKKHDGKGKEHLVGYVEKDRTGLLPKKIEDFSIKALEKAWGSFFERDAEATENVFVGGDGTVRGLDGSDPVVPPKKDAAPAAAKKEEAATEPAVEAPKRKRGRPKGSKKAAAKKDEPKPEPAAEPAAEETPVAEEPKSVPYDVHKAAIEAFVYLGGSEQTAREWIDKQTAQNAQPDTIKAMAEAMKPRHMGLKALLDLRATLKIPDASWAKILKKRDAANVGALADEQILDIVGKLETKLTEDQLAKHVTRWPFRQAADATA